MYQAQNMDIAVYVIICVLHCTDVEVSKVFPFLVLLTLFNNMQLLMYSFGWTS